MPGLRSFRVAGWGWVAEIGGCIAECAHPREKSAPDVEDASIRRFTSRPYASKTKVVTETSLPEALPFSYHAERACASGIPQQERILPYLDFLKLLGSACLGAIALYVVARNQNRQPFSVLQALGYNLRLAGTNKLLLVTDILDSSLLGGVLVLIVAAPETPQLAAMGGLGWTGIMSSYSKEIQVPRGEGDSGAMAITTQKSSND